MKLGTTQVIAALLDRKVVLKKRLLFSIALALLIPIKKTTSDETE